MRGARPREQGRDWGLHDLQQTWLPTGLPRHVCPVRWATVRRTGFRRRQCQVLWILQIPLQQTETQREGQTQAPAQKVLRALLVRRCGLDRLHGEELQQRQQRGSVPVSSSQKRQEDAGAGRFTNANFQEVPSHPGGVAKDGPPTEGKSSEGKGKRTSSHSSGQRGRKSATSKPPLSAAVSAAPPTATTPSSSPFQQGVHLALKSSGGAAVAQPAAEFLSFSESDPRNDSSYAQPSFARAPACRPERAAPRGAPSERRQRADVAAAAPPPPAASRRRTRARRPPPLVQALLLFLFLGRRARRGRRQGEEEAGKWRNRYGPCWSLDPTTPGARPPAPARLGRPALPSANSAPSAPQRRRRAAWSRSPPLSSGTEVYRATASAPHPLDQVPSPAVTPWRL
ncbi:hypothetical protein ANANG_G00173140 [Anguilla anguilla]|uniref:Uncharacterized protein n=1 Tax=Anguilla anguilla TaxID=7936 RepID=A0A9D3RT72_ANGAN|nr:hypothetical protein ANANG_G00173140 [Anguilla anguilla]